jgi:hypothetical protein
VASLAQMLIQNTPATHWNILSCLWHLNCQINKQKNNLVLTIFRKKKKKKNNLPKTKI